ncbi:MAG TPA: FtsK/SpoIIIE domain-containing protein [Marmoricola sp.]
MAPDEVWWVDDTEHRGDELVRDLLLLDGSVLSGSRSTAVEPIKGWSVSMSGGPDAGVTVAVPLDRPLVIGRSPQADLQIDSPSLSWTHVTVTREGKGARINDAGSTNGTYVDGAKLAANGVLATGDTTVIAGGAAFTVRPDLAENLAPRPGSLHNLTASHTAPFNRPPRPGRPGEADTITPPQRKDPSPAGKFSLITVVAPLAIAMVMVISSGSMSYALVALMSPVMAVGTWWDGKRRHKRDSAEETERFGRALDTLQDDLTKAATAARARRRADAPDPAVVMRRAALPTTQMWQRRPGSDDFLSLHLGVGDVPWKPPVSAQDQSRLDGRVRDLLDDALLPAAPVIAELTDAGVVGIVGDRPGALALARSLVIQAAVHCGPADLTVGVFCDRGRDEEWSWATWLPHVRRIGAEADAQWLSASRDRSVGLLHALRDGLEHFPTPAVLLVLDSDVLTEGRDAPARSLLGRNRSVPGTAEESRTKVSGIVIAATEEQLPASCTVVVKVGDDASANASQPGDLSHVDEMTLAGISVESARRTARDLARFDDPELVVPGGALPGLVRLTPLLGINEVGADAIRDLWAHADGISAPIGMGESGPFSVDLVHDGPHGLVGGTTGSGKSEFLRSLVAGLAARNDPTRLTFILIDFKGGAAFATCERLPHTIGTVSNLDEQLADRALRALEAELRYRQRVFADAGEGVDNLDAYLATKPSTPMPRLLLVVDEFAMLAKEYPDVLSSLVSVAAVGRTLGVHMILATQRPAGVVNDDILANTNLRVALRVQSRDDSVNVIGVPAASAIDRRQRGRAYVKLGQDDISPVQTALVTGQQELQHTALIDAQPVVFGQEGQAVAAAEIDDDAPTDLDLLIDAIVAANADAGLAPARPVWPEPLGPELDLAAPGDETGPGRLVDDVVEFALADDPDHQRQLNAGWDLSRGNLLLFGIPGSGKTTALAGIALTLAAAYPPDELDLLLLDLGSRDLAPLASLPHCIGYVGSGSSAREQQVRLMKFLRKEVDRRKADPKHPHRRLVVLIDGLATLKDEFDDFEGMAHLEDLYRGYTDGPSVGIWTAATTTRAKSVPSVIEEVTTQKMLFRLADPYDYSTANVPASAAPPAIPGRCVVAETRLQAQVARPANGLEEAVARIYASCPVEQPKPSVVRELPKSLTLDEVGGTAHIDTEPWQLPVGLRESDLEPAALEVFEGEHVLIAGPARSGKSTVALTLARTLRDAAADDGSPIAVWGLGGRRSPLRDADLDKFFEEDQISTMVASARVHNQRLVVIIDDAEQFADNDQALAGLITAKLAHLHLIAVGRADDLRSLYGHWTTTVRKSRCGILLQPNVDYDGELLGVSIPRRTTAAMTTGRGYLCVSGAAALAQFATP